jgi:hypothetical protein
MEHKTFSEFYWKRAIWTIGLPWGLTTGVIIVIIQNKEVLKYFTNWTTLIQILAFVIGGFLFAYTSGRSLWKRGKSFEVRKEKERQQSETSTL